MAFRINTMIRNYIFRLHRASINKCMYSISSAGCNSDYSDIVISGGGMVGAAMACALANCKSLDNKKIVMLEAAPYKGQFQINPDKFSNRTCALNPSTVKLLDSFNAWQEIESMRCHPVLRMQVWDSCSDSLISFSNSDMTERLAYIVENDVILEGIMRALRRFGDRVEVRYQTKPEKISLSGGGDFSDITKPIVELSLNDGKMLKTKLLIGADGMNSQVRKSAGFHTVERDYAQTAIVATLVLGNTSTNNTAWQRFLPTGPIALLPLSDSLSSLVWTTTPDNAKHLLEVPSDSFVDAVNDALWHERDINTITNEALSNFKNILNYVFPEKPESLRQLPPTVVDITTDSRAAFPLRLIHSSQYVRTRLALIGDAGHRLHPLAGQGVNLGFGDVQCLTEKLSQAVKNGADIGSLTHLLDYETERQRHNVPVMMTIDGLQRLYSTEFTPVVLARALGLQATNALSSFKDVIINRASV